MEGFVCGITYRIEDGVVYEDHMRPGGKVRSYPAFCFPRDNYAIEFLEVLEEWGGARYDFDDTDRIWEAFASEHTRQELHYMCAWDAKCANEATDGETWAAYSASARQLEANFWRRWAENDDGRYWDEHERYLNGEDWQELKVKDRNGEFERLG
jgi:hypothetical protein